MRVAICSSFFPFVNGGARFIVEWLAVRLRDHGHSVEVVNLPMYEAPAEIMRQMVSYRLLDLSESADRIITTRPPAHLLQHPAKVAWFIHHFRLFYDLWDSPYRNFPDDAEHRSIRDAIRAADTTALTECRAVFTNSKTVSQRLHRYNGIESEVLYPPLLEPDRFHSEGAGDAIAYVCRIEHHKRQHLLLEAFRYVQSPVRLQLYGAGSNPVYVQSLRDAIDEWGLRDRVTLRAEWITEEEKADVLSRCLAAAYLPVDEDSYGYPSLEASYSHKPILTTSDSGGVMELVEDGVNGRVCEPDPLALAEAIDALYTDRIAAQRMGEAAYQRLRDLNIDWDHVVARLLP